MVLIRCLSGHLNTSNGDEMVNSIPENDDEDDGVKVFGEKSGDRENKFESENLSKPVDDETFDEAFAKVMGNTYIKKDNKSVLVSPDNVFDF